MKVLIIEDEQLNAERLRLLIGKYLPEAEILNHLQSVTESVEWFRENSPPDIVFLDIHLADGSAFSIFEKIKINSPIIFTTAYDEYALKSFEVNSIDYLLKPIEHTAFQRAMDKLRSLRHTNSLPDSTLFNKLSDMIKENKGIYKSSLLVAMGDKFIPLSVKEIAYLYVENKNVNAIHISGKKYVIHSSLDDIWKQLNPEHFYRANRQYIISRWGIKDISLWFGNRMTVNMKNPSPERIIISRTHVQQFKQWLTE